MKLPFTVLLMLFISAAGFSQMNSSWDIIAGVDYSNRLVYASQSSGLRSVASFYNKSEQGKINWRLGVNYNKIISNNTFFKTGIRLASVGYVYKKDNLTWGSEHDGMGGHTPDPNLPHSVRYSYDYWFIEIPLVLRFEKGKNKFSTYTEVGLSPSLYVASLLTRRFDSAKEIEFSRNNEISKINNFQLVGTFAFGANYNYSEKVQLFAQPTFRFHLTQLFKTPIKTYLFNAGLEMGLRWRN